MKLSTKLQDIERISRYVVSPRQIVVAIFKENPDLQSFKFVQEQQYDDNNYYTSTKLSDINGHSYDGEDYEEESLSDLPRIDGTDITRIEACLDIISQHWDNYETELKREDFEDECSGGCSEEEKTYLASYLSGSVLPTSFFAENHPKWATYYAMDHGRFDPEAEFEIFARRGRMLGALEYAKAFGRLSQEVENFFILDAHEDDQTWLQEYLKVFVRNKQCA